MKTQKRLVNIGFVWKTTTDQWNFVTHRLTVTVGSIELERGVNLFADPRGFYEGNSTNLLFIPDLDKAKKHAEQTILKQLKA